MRKIEGFLGSFSKSGVVVLTALPVLKALLAL
jgi:hypothetical protein